MATQLPQLSRPENNTAGGGPGASPRVPGHAAGAVAGVLSQSGASAAAPGAAAPPLGGPVAGLAACFHLGASYTGRMEAIETIRNRKMQTQDRGSASAALGSPAGTLGRPGSSGSPKGAAGAAAASPRGAAGAGGESPRRGARGSAGGQQTEPTTGSTEAAETRDSPPEKGPGGKKSEARSSVHVAQELGRGLSAAFRRNNTQFCGIERASLSGAGSWLDSRAFVGRDSAAPRKSAMLLAGRRRTTDMLSSQQQATENERFVLKRNKENLLRTLKKRDPAHLQQTMNLVEFQKATAGILNPFEARFAYNRMNLGSLEKATLQGFVARLEEL